MLNLVHRFALRGGLAAVLWSGWAYGQNYVLIPEAAFERGEEQVRLEAFEVLDHPVTNREYKQFVDAARHTPPLHWVRGRIPAGKEDHPVIFVNRSDVDAYLKWLSKRDGRLYRLPTTLEFEYAACGGLTAKSYPWGDESPKERAEFDAVGQRDYSRWQEYLKPARSGNPNGYGLHGMAGNVWQLVLANNDPATERYKYRIDNLVTLENNVMGGSWARSAEYLRCGAVLGVSAGNRYPDVGFRPVREPQGADWKIQPRKVAALSRGQGRVLVSWALLESDSAEVRFNLYRARNRRHAGVRVNEKPIEGRTSTMDSGLEAEQRYQYYVRPVDAAGREGRQSEWCAVTATAAPAQTLKLFRPLCKQGGLVPVFGDLDGDGELDCVIRLDNGNVEMSQDPGAPVQLEAFTSYGRSLWRKDICYHDHCYGSANNVPFNVWDMDGDGKAEIVTRLQAGDDDFLAVLDGMSGRVQARTEWPKMLTDFQRSSTRIHLSVALLDGKQPAIVTQTGLYENEVIAAYDRRLRKLWQYDSVAETSGSGGHKIEAADVDGDGKQEVFVGSLCLNSDGTLRWATYRQHPDIVSIHDYLPNRPGLEVFYLVESSIHAGAYLVAADSGEIIWKHNREQDPRWIHGHAGWTADIWEGSPGMECAGNRAGHNDQHWVLYSADGRILQEPFAAGLTPVEWDGDAARELLADGGRTLLNFDGAAVVPAPDEQPNPLPAGDVIMTADLYGDFRDELVVSTETPDGGRAVAVVMAPTPLAKRFISRTESLEYRLWLARNMGGGYRSVYDERLR